MLAIIYLVGIIFAYILTLKNSMQTLKASDWHLEGARSISYILQPSHGRRRKNKRSSSRVHCKLFCYSASIVLLRSHGTINDYCRCILMTVMTMDFQNE
ncbi:hypothetical protein RchiOBHm_Chr5g0046831 [Rosa chinensis]|uniref:Uncharacterized protein n=1 Tax=Rosa chinensis TaxID=74649 RepID=A0A2P6QE67_ROSCH|nr:hypothetical protein RchiOBHm_Chr5g0046831 [Rosa chinensis]